MAAILPTRRLAEASRLAKGAPRFDLVRHVRLSVRMQVKVSVCLAFDRQSFPLTAGVDSHGTGLRLTHRPVEQADVEQPLFETAHCSPLPDQPSGSRRMAGHQGLAGAAVDRNVSHYLSLSLIAQTGHYLPRR
jgi:hypothetical protein